MALISRHAPIPSERSWCQTLAAWMPSAKQLKAGLVLWLLSTAAGRAQAASPPLNGARVTAGGASSGAGTAEPVFHPEHPNPLLRDINNHLLISSIHVAVQQKIEQLDLFRQASALIDAYRLTVNNASAAADPAVRQRQADALGQLLQHGLTVEEIAKLQYLAQLKLHGYGTDYHHNHAMMASRILTAFCKLPPARAVEAVRDLFEEYWQADGLTAGQPSRLRQRLHDSLDRLAAGADQDVDIVVDLLYALLVQLNALHKQQAMARRHREPLALDLPLLRRNDERLGSLFNSLKKIETFPPSRITLHIHSKTFLLIGDAFVRIFSEHRRALAALGDWRAYAVAEGHIEAIERLAKGVLSQTVAVCYANDTTLLQGSRKDIDAFFNATPSWEDKANALHDHTTRRLEDYWEGSSSVARACASTALLLAAATVLTYLYPDGARRRRPPNEWIISSVALPRLPMGAALRQRH